MGTGIPANSRELLTVVEAAQVARVIPRTIRVWIRSGKLTCYKAGPEYRVHTAELDEFLRFGRVGLDPAIDRLVAAASTLDEEQRRRLAAILHEANRVSGGGS